MTSMPSQVLTLPAYLEIVAVTTGALSGALHANRRDFDFVGVIMIALCTGIGGGAIRDVVLSDGVPVFLTSSTMLLNALLAAVAGFLFAAAVRSFMPVMLIIDALLIGVWVVIGIQRTLLIGLSPWTAGFIGVVACVGGGVLRDILCRDKPEVLMPGRLYAAAAIAAAGAYLGLAAVGAPVAACVAAAIIVAAVLRWASEHFGWSTRPAQEPVSDASVLP